MVTSNFDKDKQKAARDTLDEIVKLLEGYTPSDGDPEIEGAKLVHLLNRNFKRIDPNNNGISREELVAALSKPGDFSKDEYMMLHLVSKYFRTIAEMNDDEPEAPDSVITSVDKDVLAQFLVHSKMTLAQLQEWFRIDQKKKEFGPPPLTGQQ